MPDIMIKRLESYSDNLLNKEVQRLVNEANENLKDLGFEVEFIGGVIVVSRDIYTHSNYIPKYWKDLNIPLGNTVNEVIALSVKFITLQILKH